MRFFIVLILLFMVVNFTFAQETIAELDEWGDKVLGLIGSNWVKAIAALGFAIESGALIFAGRQQEGMLKKFMPWMMGTIGLLAVSSIVDFFWGKT